LLYMGTQMTPEVIQALQDRIKWLETDNRNLKQTLDYARKELHKADRRAADFADQISELKKFANSSKPQV